MHAAVAAARVVLAAVFAFAAVAKARDRAGTAAGARALGVPGRATGALAVALPPAELGAAALLLAPPTARFGAVIAAVLLLFFSAAVGRTLHAGRRPVCHCFGTGATRPIGADTLVRNAALLALAIVSAFGRT